LIEFLLEIIVIDSMIVDKKLFAYGTWEVSYMKIDKVVKYMIGCASAAFIIAVPSKAFAAEIAPEEGFAGIAYSFDQYYASTEGSEDGSADKVLTQILKSDIISPYANLGVSKADNYVNIRKEPNTDSEIVGKLYRGCATNILEYLKDDWVKIESGKVKGYIAVNYLAIGQDAEAMVDEYAEKYATVVGTKTLRVREGQGKDTKTLTLIAEGEKYPVLKEHDKWVEILLSTDEDGKDYTGFVSKDYIEITVKFKYAVTIEEELEKERLQREAEEAEQERLRKLEEEKAEKAERDRQKQEEHDRDDSSSNNSSNNDKEDDNDDYVPSSDSGDISSLRQEVASYAQKFVGNPYVWGGTSLTHGADCSGFVQTIYAQFGYSIPRVSRDQAGAGKRVDYDDRRPGDLIFYTNGSGTVNHVAMYIGNNMIVHAANRRQGIIISVFNYRSIYCIRRIIY
jgi:cell wall-associated NlpC family hydrolase